MTTNSAAELCALTERFDLALDPDSVRFNEAGLGARCQALIDAGPLNYALFALQSGDPAHRAAAESQLNPGR